ncbi:XRE family transcriptional regulator [Caballeronia sp. LZ001]|uniref:helix-turn-helix domain-containing protein n=1 Tax=Caballeronia sp. LZ001 TaxID=3038553 RepID=UPI0028667653|nr:XRE family transcriptional regulator [Caballeronia sp. LZ001]MDR5802586.1 XRE family transcriptional regulator [Caballeronia sp. LZ001]
MQLITGQTTRGKSVFYDLFADSEAASLEMRAILLQGLSTWLDGQTMTQAAVAKVLGTKQARVSDIKRGKINQFSLDLLVRLAARAGLHPRIELESSQPKIAFERR